MTASHPDPSPAGDRRPHDEGDTPSLSIAALDDDADFREYIAGLLADDGHQVVVAADPEALFALCEDALPDVVLLDMKMGVASGEEVLSVLRERWPRLCVIVLTGYPSLESMRNTFKAEVFDYLSKPFSADVLRRSLSEAAERFNLGRRPQDRLRIELGKRVRLARTQRVWTLKELSEASSVSVSQLSSIERGAHMPSLESLLVVAMALGVRPSVWLEDSGF